MYFDEFTKLPYDFKFGDDDYRIQVVRDITKNIRFRKDFLNSLSMYNTYSIQDGDTPEIISEKIYGTPYYHWVLMIVNQKYDYINDFPQSGTKLDILVENKYGDRKYDVHHYENFNGDQVTGKQIMTLPFNPWLEEEGLYLMDKILPGQTVRRQNSLGGYSGIISSVDRPNKTIFVTMSFGGFVEGDEVDIVKYTVDSDNVPVEDIIITFVPNEIEYPYNVNPVTNYDFELKENEKKRTIKVIPKAYLDQIMSEFTEFIKL